ncbi:hypothetical protein MG599_04435 [Paenarthrobacter sp. SD-1]|uniref:hypothetical protein n=1 Tax=unclassified Paenarthrobacter TaxID=2634190 RepID=UPI002699BD43|nr:hypothetical protein [Paenarthrobacter sp. SD-1]MDO5874551.1 hypothetical protein [Paenarthrobacter sp. SD-1]
MKKYCRRGPRDGTVATTSIQNAAHSPTEATTSFVPLLRLPDYNGPLFPDIAD